MSDVCLPALSGRHALALLSSLVTCVSLLGVLAAGAGATQYQRPLKEVFGPVEQPAFHRAEAIAVDHKTGDVLVLDPGGNANQTVTFSGFAEGDQFTLANLPAACSGSSTEEIEYSTTRSALVANIGAKLEERCGAGNIEVTGTANVIGLQFLGPFKGAPVPLMSCAVVSGHGSGNCPVAVTQFGAHRGIYRFHADGTPAPFAALGTDRIDGEGSGTCTYPPTPSPACDKTPLGEISVLGGLTDGIQIAVDESSGPAGGDIYVTQEHGNPNAFNGVVIFSADGKYLGSLTAGKGGTSKAVGGVGVDATGAVYISSKWGTGPTAIQGVSKYVPSSNPPRNLDSTVTFPVPTAGLPAGGSYGDGLGHLALGAGPTAGSLFLAANTANPHTVNVVKMNTVTGEGARFVAGYGEQVSVDPMSGNPITLSGSNRAELLEFDGTAETASEPLSRLSVEGIEGVVGSTVASMGFNSAGEVDVTTIGGHVYTYGHPAVVPGVTAEEAEEATTTTATLAGSVEPEGIEVTECFFEWGPTTSYGHTAPCVGTIPTDSDAHQVTAAISGLTPNGVTYHYRLAARNENGLERSADETLQTAHTVRTEAATVTGAHTATLKATVRPEGHQYTECVFEYGLASHPAAYEHTVPCEPPAASIPPDSAPHMVEAQVSGLQEATAYRFRIKAANPAEGTLEGEEETFETFGPPQLLAVRASGATQDSATLEAEINPSGFDTSYLFEWGPTDSYAHTVPATFESIGAGTDAVRVTAPIAGLSAATTYHYRVTAESSAGEPMSADQTLETLNSCGLPDGRCLEMVSRREPGPYAQPGEFFAYPEIHFQASETPGKLAYAAELGYPEATRGAEILYLGQRGAEGWVSGQLAPPVTAPDELHNVSSVPSVFLGLSPDLSCGVVTSTQPLSSNPAAQLTLEAGGANLYRRNADGTYTLVTDLPPSPLEELGSNLYSIFQLVGSSADCSKIVFKTSYHYAGLPGIGSSRLYEWTETGGMRYAGFVPASGGGEAVVEASAGGYKALSEDGSRLFFSAKRSVGRVSGEVGKTGVFVREGGTSTDVSASATSVPDEGATFEGATPDGSRVYFTANHGLTAESSPEGTDLYEYDLEDEELTDISVGQEAGGAQVGGEGSNHNFGALVGVAADGSHAYYIARGQLVAGLGRTLAANKTADTFSLYDYDSATKAVRFVGTVTGEDVESVTFARGGATSRVSPDGRYLLFESSADVTDYASGGAPEAYLYDAEALAARPTVCVSCRQDGGASVEGGSFHPLALGSNSLSQPQSLVIRGRPLVFFDSEDSLAPGAVAGESNLYEWAGGQVFLVAAEGKTENFGFIGAAADGTDLYFYATAALNWEDPEGRPAAWDARIGGSFPQPPSPPNPCDAASEGSCSPGTASVPAAPPAAASKSFEGPGNVKPKPKQHKKKHQKKKHKQHKKKHKTKGKHKKAKRQGGQAK
jgi:hypothetical protein